MGALLCSLLALVLGGIGAGPKEMETVVQDDAQFLHRPAAVVRANAHRLADLGADRLRLTAGWSALAPSPHRRVMPGAPFDPTDSATYPHGAFAALDTAVKAAHDAGLGVMIDLAFWAPRWAVGSPAGDPSRERWWIQADRFADFATAVARRYSGAFRDPANPRQMLPTVRMYTTWNEPNHPSFLQPQWVRTPSGGWRPESPHIYRAMHEAAYDAIKRVAAQDQVLVGGTASTGSAEPGRGGVPPLEFLRTMACVDARMRPLRVPECRHYTPIRADGYAHHPYARFVTPDTSDPHPDDVPIADVSRLGSLLEVLHRMGRITSDLGVYDTEFGYESNQDDPYQPFDRDEQARFLAWSTYLAWKDPHTKMFAQFLLRDIAPSESGRRRGTRSYYRDWQTGLYDADGNPKPAATAFKLPFWAQTEGSGATRAVLLFGGVRPGTGAQTVRVERHDDRTGAWVPVQTYGPSCGATDPGAFLTDRTGYFLRTAPFVGAGTYRMSWQHPDGAWEPGIPVSVAEDGNAKPPV